MSSQGYKVQLSVVSVCLVKNSKKNGKTHSGMT